jgi:hypothetical protein
MRGRSAEPGKLGSHPDNYLLQCLPLPFFRRQNGNLFRLLSLDTLGRTESHPRDSKQTIGVTLTRHSCEGALSQVSRAELAGALRVSTECGCAEARAQRGQTVFHRAQFAR